ncbi:MAG: hypothetical protein EZS28_030708, partial [Streblomastix strix]
MALALEPPIVSQSSSEVIMEKTKDGDTIRIFGSDKPAQQKDFQSPAPVSDNSKHSDEELIEISDDKMNSRQLMVAYGERSGKIFILDNGDIVAEVRDSGFYDQLTLIIAIPSIIEFETFLLSQSYSFLPWKSQYLPLTVLI